MKKALRIVLILIFLVIFGVSAWKIYETLNVYKTGTDSYADLSQYVTFETAPPAQAPRPHGTEPNRESDASLANTLWPQVDFASLQAINPDIVGWLFIEGTEINYPVVQAGDNDYYLNHLFDGTRNAAGCLFLDAVNEPDFSGQNSIIYGHQMKNGSMFHDLMEYKQQDFYDQHPTGMLVTPEGRYKIRFFSGYVSGINASSWDTVFADYQQWLDELKAKSRFDSDVVPTENDRVLTLSTCSYEYDNARFTLHGILQASSSGR